MNKPRYADRIIVGVRSNDGFCWHISDRDIWIMDIYKYQKSYQNIGHNINIEFILGLRNNIPIFNENNYIEYLDLNDDEAVNTDELKSAIINFDYNDTILAYQPSIYVDFICRELFSMYPENIPYEAYVPGGWNGECSSFLEKIPVKEQYWNVDGKDLLEEIFKREVECFEKGVKNEKQ